MGFIFCQNNLRKLDVRIHRSFSALNPQEWDSLVDDGDLFMHFDYLRVLEETCLSKDIHPVYVTAYEKDQLVALAYFQLIDFHGGHLKAYMPSKRSSNKAVRGISDITSRMFEHVSMTVMSSGNFFTTGERCFYTKRDMSPDLSSELLRKLCNETRAKLCSEQNVGITLLSDFYESDLSICDANLQQNNFRPFFTEDDMVLNLSESWSSFDNYMEALSSKYRVRCKKVLKDSMPLIRRRMYAVDVNKHIEALYDLYMNVASKVKFNLGFIGKNYMLELCRQMPDRFRIYGYYLPSDIPGADEQLVGFTSLFVDGKRMFVHYIGLNYHVNKQYQLYGRMLYDDIRLGIEEGLDCINFGRTAQEIKSTVGATPLKLKSYIKATNPALNLFMPKFVQWMRPAEWVLRDPFRKPETR